MKIGLQHFHDFMEVQKDNKWAICMTAYHFVQNDKLTYTYGPSLLLVDRPLTTALQPLLSCAAATSCRQNGKTYSKSWIRSQTNGPLIVFLHLHKIVKVLYFHFSIPFPLHYVIMVTCLIFENIDSSLLPLNNDEISLMA